MGVGSRPSHSLDTSGSFPFVVGEECGEVGGGGGGSPLVLEFASGHKCMNHDSNPDDDRAVGARSRSNPMNFYGGGARWRSNPMQSY